MRDTDMCNFPHAGLSSIVYSKQASMCSLIPKDQKKDPRCDEVRGDFLGRHEAHTFA